MEIAQVHGRIQTGMRKRMYAYKSYGHRMSYYLFNRINIINARQVVLISSSNYLDESFAFFLFCIYFVNIRTEMQWAQSIGH